MVPSPLNRPPPCLRDSKGANDARGLDFPLGLPGAIIPGLFSMVKKTYQRWVCEVCSRLCPWARQCSLCRGAPPSMLAMQAPSLLVGPTAPPLPEAQAPPADAGESLGSGNVPFEGVPHSFSPGPKRTPGEFDATLLDSLSSPSSLILSVPYALRGISASALLTALRDFVAPPPSLVVDRLEVVGAARSHHLAASPRRPGPGAPWHPPWLAVSAYGVKAICPPWHTPYGRHPRHQRRRRGAGCGRGFVHGFTLRGSSGRVGTGLSQSHQAT